MTLDIEATVIAEKIVEDLNIHVVAVGTTSIHVTVISTSQFSKIRFLIPKVGR